MNNYPLDFDPRRVQEPPVEICPDCGGEMEEEFFWENGKKSHQTGDTICSDCGLRR